MTITFSHDMLLLRSQVKLLIQRKVEEVYSITDRGIEYDSNFEALLSALIARVDELRTGSGLLVDDCYTTDEIDNTIDVFVEDMVDEAWDYRFPQYEV